MKDLWFSWAIGCATGFGLCVLSRMAVELYEQRQLRKRVQAAFEKMRQEAERQLLAYEVTPGCDCPVCTAARQIQRIGPTTRVEGSPSQVIDQITRGPT
jgi:hypothetical protein